MTPEEKDCILRVDWRIRRALVLLNRLNPSPVVEQIVKILELSISDIDHMLSNESPPEGGVSGGVSEVARTITKAVRVTRKDAVTLLRFLRDAQKSLYQQEIVHAQHQIAAALRVMDSVMDDIALLEHFTSSQER